MHPSKTHWLINVYFVTLIICLCQHTTTKTDILLPAYKILLFPLIFLEAAPFSYSVTGCLLSEFNKASYAHYSRVCHCIVYKCTVLSFSLSKATYKQHGWGGVTAYPIV